MSAANLMPEGGRERLERVVFGPEKTPRFDPRDGIESELGWLTEKIAAREPVPLGLAAQTFGTAVAVVYLTTRVLSTAGVRGPLAVSVAAVAAPIAIQVMRRRARG